MPSSKFLIVDDNADSRFLLVKTLLRKFPHAVIQECQNADTAVQVAQKENPTAVVVHRASDMDGLSLVQFVRRVNPTVPLVMVSGYDREAEARAAGATAFLNYDEWLRIGLLVGELLRPANGAETI